MSPNRKPSPLNIGFLPLLDAAPIIAAKELDLFSNAGIDVRIRCEPGWATIYDKFLFGEIDAAHALAGQALLMCAGGFPRVGTAPVASFLNRGGAFIVLSKEWKDRGIASAKQLLAASRSTGARRKLILGAVNRRSSHRFLLEQWLNEAGAKKDECQFVFLPPSLLARNLQLGHLDGFCAGEPWCTHSAAEEWGVIVESGENLAPNHPDKVLLISNSTREEQPERSVALLQSVTAAAQWCDQQENHSQLSEMLSQRRYLNLPFDILLEALGGGSKKSGQRVRFDAGAVRPDGSRLTWLAQQWRNHNWDGVEHLPGLLNPKLFASAVQGLARQHEHDS